ncbi:MAG: histidine phosphatase family protein [Treponema sp.]|uniref:histidine phosphatase family protein n=1 Tax=Treponema sp. TaxID=166 RepID=UPI00298DACFB|nr:histidine phosphatase family protein [Treponema sp.]MBR5933492.1 histidine phosphatase family protein [Treponema sp.]
MRIVFVRHGDPNYELDCLTQKGVKQAEIAAQRLLCEEIEEIYSSPQGRALETAEAFSKASGISKINVIDFMKEIRYGPEDELYQEQWNPWIGAGAMAERGEDIRNPQWRNLDLFKTSTAVYDTDKIAKDADEWLKTLGYVREGLYYRNTRKDDSQHTIALFSHGGSSTAFISHALNLEFPYMCATLHIQHTGITILRFSKEPGSLSIPVLELANDYRHINTEQMTKKKILCVKYICKDGMRDAFYNAIKDNRIDVLSQAEEGNLKYEYSFSAEDKNALILTELWKNDDAVRSHREEAHFKKLGDLKSQFVERTEIKRFDGEESFD